MNFSERLKQLMSENNVTSKQLSEHTHIGKNMVKYWSDHGNLPRWNTLKAIADYFNVSVDYLIGKSDIKNPTANNDDGKNTIKIAGRDGSYIEKRLSDEQIEMLKTMINSLPDAPDNL